ncbi:hypothetical protein [Deinococcus roseus]|uniref:Uncharacterized protein n=1 Tax=Deinococcus roseus TaxID=392414 RepID=A0ABQ2DAW5_9DEIO|nr:hypothetical protein [Deinococcus roseus]GGJ51738.1 hypothetical protein GCM10008938_42220 [Deinococcus roseus]
MQPSASDAYTEGCIQDACRLALQNLREARFHLARHPETAQLLLDSTHDLYLTAREHSRRSGRESALLDRLYQQWLETQQELDPLACQDHALALSLAREHLFCYRLHETGDPGLDRLLLKTEAFTAVLQKAYRHAAGGELPALLLQACLRSLNMLQVPEKWVRPRQLGAALRQTLRAGREAQ